MQSQNEQRIISYVLNLPDSIKKLKRLNDKFFSKKEDREIFRLLKSGVTSPSEIIENFPQRDQKRIEEYLDTRKADSWPVPIERIQQVIDFNHKKSLEKLIIKSIDNEVKTGKYDFKKICELRQKIEELNNSNKELETVKLSTIPSKKVDWLWENYLPLGRLALISGDPNDGKTYLALDLSSRITKGTRWPDGEKISTPGTVLYLTVEDQAADTLRPRIDNLGGDPENIEILNPDSEDFLSFAQKEGLELFENRIKNLSDLRLCVIDPILDFTENINPNRVEQVRPLLSSLQKIAEKNNVSIILISHLNKAQSMSALYRTGGTTQGWLGKCRAAFMIFRDQADKKIRYFAPLKSNLAPRDPDKWSFTIEEGKIFYQKAADDLDIDEKINPNLRAEAQETTYAANWLTNFLKDGKEEDVNKIEKEAEKVDIKRGKLHRTADKLGIIKDVTGFGKDKKSMWRLP